MLVRLGDTVFGVAGKEMGKVAGIVVNAGTMRADGVLVHAGLLNREEHILAVSAITSADAQGLHLDSTSKTADADSPVLDSEEIALAQRVQPEETYLPAAGVGGPVYATDPTRSGPYPDESSFFEMAPIDPPPVEIFSNLGENDVKLLGNTEVLSSDGHKIGKATAYHLGDMGLVDAVVVAEGVFHGEEATFTTADIDEFGTDKVHLKLSRADAEAR